ncbi:hypothetical protein KAOT1_00140 [Kordia algicida OT-1]|uniref:Uncharacterized protein n=1 Tax=Kordia algicida OT-1 TaxID=391587 RepID=A9CUA5_9FLAO|nr:hypothetical protein KAOT1_00140 [Kordia algicida OT-1]
MQNSGNITVNVTVSDSVEIQKINYIRKMNNTLIKAQKIILTLSVLIMNILFTHKVIELSFPSDPNLGIFQPDEFIEYFQPFSFIFIMITVYLMFLAQYKERLRDLYCVTLNFGLVLACTHGYMKLNLIGIILSVTSLIMIFLNNQKSFKNKST